MESQRSLLFITLIIVSYLLYNEWQKDYNPLPTTTEQTQQQTQSSNIPVGDVTASADIPQSSDAAIPATPKVSEHLITVTTNVLEIKINTKGGDIVAAKLLNYPVTQNEPQLVELLSQYHVAQSGLIGADGPDGRKEGRPTYVANQLNFSASGDNDIVVPMKWTNSQGITYTKTYTFKANEYDINLAYTINNNSSKIVQVQTFAQLKKNIFAPENSMMVKKTSTKNMT